jgi:hypothetical protein
MLACGQYQEGMNEDLQQVLGELDIPCTISEVSTPMAAAQPEGADLTARCGVFEVGGRASMGLCMTIVLGSWGYVCLCAPRTCSRRKQA